MPEIFSAQNPEACHTTLEMDGLFTEEDIANQYLIMGQCKLCDEWSQWDSRYGKWKCSYCGTDKYDIRGSRSIRTWLTTKDIKKTKARKKTSA